MGKKTGPKRSNLPRTPDGSRVSRAVDVEKMREAAEVETAVKKRMQLWGLGHKESRDQRAATPIGRLSLQWSAKEDHDNSHAIDAQQYAALNEVRLLYVRYLRAIDAKGDIASPGFEMVSRGLTVLADIDDEDEAKRLNKIRARYNDVKRAITEECGRDAWAATFRIACEEQQPNSATNVAHLRMAANTVNRLWSGKKRLAA